MLNRSFVTLVIVLVLFVTVMFALYGLRVDILFSAIVGGAVTVLTTIIAYDALKNRRRQFTVSSISRSNKTKEAIASTKQPNTQINEQLVQLLQQILNQGAMQTKSSNQLQASQTSMKPKPKEEIEEQLTMKPEILKFAPTGRYYCPYCKREIPESEAIFIPNGDGWTDEDIIAGLEKFGSEYGLKRVVKPIAVYDEEEGTMTSKNVIAYVKEDFVPEEKKLKVGKGEVRIVIEGNADKIRDILARLGSETNQPRKTQTKTTRRRPQKREEHIEEEANEVEQEFSGEWGEGEVNEKIEKEFFEEEEEEEPRVE